MKARAVERAKAAHRASAFTRYLADVLTKGTGVRLLLTTRRSCYLGQGSGEGNGGDATLSDDDSDDGRGGVGVDDLTDANLPAKVTHHLLGGLAPRDAAMLFARRAHRRIDLRIEDLSTHEAVRVLEGHPCRIQRAASKVTDDLASLDDLLA